MELNVDLAPGRPGALALRNPIMAAGPVGYGREFMRLAGMETVGALVTQITTLQRHAGSPTPRLAATAAGALVGQAPNPGLPAVLRDRSDIWAGWAPLVILAVCGRSPDEYAIIGSQVEGEAGIAGLEMDLSGPPEPGRPHAGWDPAEAWLAVRAMRQASTLPILARLPWSGPALIEVARAAALAGADALTLVASPPGLSIDVEGGRIEMAGGLTGPALLPLVLHCLRQVSRELEVPLVAGDGVSSGADAMACLLAGATAIQVNSAALGDPRAAVRVLAELTECGQQMGLSALQAVIGTAR